MTQPLPIHFDYQGNERCEGYVRGVTNVPCKRCRTTGVDPIANDPTNCCGNFYTSGGPFSDGPSIDTGIPVCRNCGGYGCVPPVPAAETEEPKAAFEPFGAKFVAWISASPSRRARSGSSVNSAVAPLPRGAPGLRTVSTRSPSTSFSDRYSG